MFKNHPKGLIPAALANMGERFGYYIMNAVLTLFLCSKFGLSDETGSLIYSFFYAGIYVLSLVGGFIADRTQNYKGTIINGLVVMSLGYILLSIPILSTENNIVWLLPLTCFALLLIAFGNGLFKGNLQAIVGQLYDNYEAEAAKKGPEALAVAKSRRDSGFQIFYVFINIGGLIAPFVAPLLRNWWLSANNMVYNAGLPALCHEYIEQGTAMAADSMANLTELVGKASTVAVTDLGSFCTSYLDVFNTGIHYSFIASVIAMLISLVIFVATKKILPNPAKKEEKAAATYTQEEKMQMAKEIKQRMYALFAVLGIVIFFWFSFHQNGTSLSLFARDFVNIMLFFGSLARRGKEISTPRKIAYGMCIAGIAYLILAIFSYANGYPSATDFKAMSDSAKEGMMAGPWILIVLYFFLTLAELFISPLGLSFVSKIAPKHLQGLCQGLWLGATAVGNLLLWIGPLMYNKIPIWQCWTVFFAVCLISMGVMFAMVKWLERVAK